MRPTLRQLEYIVAVAECERFGEAARVLNVSQPTLSAQIAEVEAELGIDVFERGRHGAIPTPVGQELIERAKQILGLVRDFKALAKRGAGSLTGRVELGVLPSIGPYFLPQATRILHAEFPELRLAVREERTVDLDTALREGLVDVIISTEPDHPDCASMALFEEDIWISAAPDHPLSAGSGPIGIEELRGEDLLALGHGHRLSKIVERVARESGAHVNTDYRGTSLDAVRQMATMGAGLACLPTLYAIAEARRDPALIVRRLNHDPSKRMISLFWRDSSPLEKVFQTMGLILRDVAFDLLDGHN